MLYVGHFSFNGSGRFPELGDEPEHGHFTCMAEADSIEGATEKFEALFMSLRQQNELFRSVKEIYLDSCAEVRRVPPQGMVSHFEAVLGEAAPAMSVPLPNVSTEDAEAFSIMQADQNEDDWDRDDEDDDEDDRVPFMVFD